ncbi:hypothetical protein [Ralstonia sp. Ralssp110]|uniref:hypothetical protein n=1 Tax=Ralstonia sp. Ralssp110 TaxID=3243004 RepID=UPI0039B5773C
MADYGGLITSATPIRSPYPIVGEPRVEIPPKLRFGPLVLVGVIVAGCELSAVYVHALEQRLASHATRIQMTREPGHVVYTCPAKNGFVYTGPPQADLRGLSEDRT